VGFHLHPVNPNTELAIAAVVMAATDHACQDVSIDRQIQDMMWNAAAGTLNQSGYLLMVMSGMDEVFWVHVALELPVVTRYVSP
jgi:hypothetical protein